MNHYKTLSVPRNATAATIKLAYRALAKACHPDAGGDPERFKAISLAYATLSDPKKRERYDRTGEDTAPGVDPERVARMQTIEAVLAALMDSDKDALRYQNIPGSIIEVVRDRIADVSKNIAAAEKSKADIVRLIGRVKTKLPDAEEPISAILRTRVAGLDISIAAAKADVAMLQGVVEILEGLTDTPEDRPVLSDPVDRVSKYHRDMLDTILGSGRF